MSDAPLSDAARQIVSLLNKIEMDAYRRGKDEIVKKLLAVLQGEQTSNSSAQHGFDQPIDHVPFGNPSDHGHGHQFDHDSGHH